VLLFRPDGALILQQRAASKDVCPGCWDLSAAEHLKPGESYIDAAHRGLGEELGLYGITLEPACPVRRQVFEGPGVWDREVQQTFHGTTADAVTPDPGEVAGVREITLAALREEMTEAPERFTPWFVSIAHACALFE
jgi:isopentenyl-diphosphate delta-isomerase